MKVWMYIAIVLIVIAIIRKIVFPEGFQPLKGADLYKKIAQFYDQASGIWERDWGEHMHTGHYGRDGQLKVGHIEAQELMIEELIKIANVQHPVSILDCGCGIGGSSRVLAKQFGPDCKVVGISLSPFQIERAKELTKLAKQDDQVSFQVANALEMPFPDDSFDFVWSLESGEHMPDKEKWLSEVKRVLKPNGVFACATWCHREGAPLTFEEKKHLRSICAHYALPRWVSLSSYIQLAEKLGFHHLVSEDWTKAVLPFWPAVIKAALRPATLLGLLRSGWVTIKGAITAYLMMTGFDKGLLVFGVFVARK